MQSQYRPKASTQSAQSRASDNALLHRTQKEKPEHSPHRYPAAALVREETKELIDSTLRAAEPFDGDHVLLRGAYLAANHQGLKVVLDGAAADTVMSAGNPVAQLFRSGQIREALREAHGESRFWGPAWPFRKAVLSGLSALLPTPIRQLKRTLTSVIDDLGALAGLLKMSRSFARSARLSVRRKTYRELAFVRPAHGPASRLKAVTHPNLAVARERYDRIAADFGVEARDPFMDIRLIDFCLRLPAKQLQADGWPKLILRKAMEGPVPDAVIWRRGKEHLGATFATRLASIMRREKQYFSGLGDDLIRITGLKRWADILTADAKPTDPNWTDTFFLAIWLNRAVDRFNSRVL